MKRREEPRRPGDPHRDAHGPTDERGAPLGMRVEGPENSTVIVADAPALSGSGGGLVGLLRDNLFKDARNSILSLVFGAILVYVAWKGFGYVFLNDKVMPDGTVRSSWEVVRDGPLVVYMVGNQFGNTGVGFELLWTGVWAISFTLGLGIGTARDPQAPPTRLGTRLGMTLPPLLGAAAILSMTTTITPTLLTLVAAAFLVAGRWVGAHLPVVVRRRAGLLFAGLVALSFLLLTGFEPTNVNQFGGLLLTVVVSFAGIVLSFPIGVVMALARRSSFPLVRPVAVAYIELIRGVPLITLLFMGQFAVGFLFPPGMTIPGVVPRAIIMITLFTGAYVAEIVRGGLQSVPAGQTEAARAIGLSPLKTTGMIVLPQALRNSIPALIGQFLSLLKDTSLLSIIGIFEILGVTAFVLGRLEFANQNFTPESYAFVGFIYWIICFSLSRASQRLETRLGVGTR